MLQSSTGKSTPGNVTSAADGFYQHSRLPTGRGKAVAAVQNSLNAVAHALENGITIQKERLVATSVSNPDRQLAFTLDTGLGVAGQKLPKSEKGIDEDPSLLLNTDVCAAEADMVEEWLQPEEDQAGR